MLAIGPFLQQIVNNSIQALKSDGATIPVAYNYAYPLSTDVDLRMKSAIWGGLLSNNNSATQFDVPVTCSTSNCTWQDYTNLAVCASCADLAAQLTVSTENNTIKGDAPNIFHKLPNGISLQTYELALGLQMTVNSTTQPGSLAHNSIAFKANNNTILDMFVIALDNGSSTQSIAYGPYAAECIIEFCVQNYTAKVTNGTFHETRDGKGVLIQSYVNETFGTQDGERSFGVDYNTLIVFSTYLANLFFGRVIFTDSLSPQAIFPSDVTQSIWLHLEQEPHTLDSMFANIEQSMTRAVRTQPGGSEQMQGSALVQQTVIRVDWPWISLPVAILVSCVIFLVVIVTYTRRSGLEPWKETSIATLFHVIDVQNDRKVLRLAHQDQILDATRGMYVRLRSDERSQFIEQTRIDT